jgi:beta-N-acetylhexosaminidase
MNAEQLLGQMTLEEKVGQLFLLAFAGHRLDEARLLMEQHLVGGAYISNDNIPTPEAALHLTRELQSYAASTRLGIPLLLGCDQEGAWGDMALGATHDPTYARHMYRVIGTELSAVGLNALLAPCADCNSNPMNSIIGMRSFGEKPQLVGVMTAAAVRGAHDGGVIATVKHYPGHGDTRLDTHRGLPTVDRNREELYAIDLHPFAEGIKAGADIVMTAHIIFSALDPDRPATLSPIILQDILRGEMGFDGVILSDSMNMGAMRKNYDPQKSAVQALRAGVDMIMLAEEHYDHDAAHYVSQQLALLKAVTQAVETRELPVERIDDAVRRILSLKARLASGVGSASSMDADKQALDIVGSAEHRQVELEAARHAVAVLRNGRGLVPLPEERPVILVNTTVRRSYEPLGSTRGIGPNQTLPAFDMFADELQRRRPVIEVWSAEKVIESDQLPDLSSDVVVVAVTENYPLPGMDFDQSSQPEVLRLLMRSLSERLVVIALRDPYELRYLSDLATYLCAFSFRPCAAQAAAEVLCGEVPPYGHTPVSVPDAGLEA